MVAGRVGIGWPYITDTSGGTLAAVCVCVCGLDCCGCKQNEALWTVLKSASHREHILLLRLPISIVYLLTIKNKIATTIVNTGAKGTVSSDTQKHTTTYSVYTHTLI